MDSTDSYVAETVKAGSKANLDDIGSIISLAILTSKGNHQQAIEALERATAALSKSEIGVQAAQCFGGAIYNLQVWIESES